MAKDIYDIAAKTALEGSYFQRAITERQRRESLVRFGVEDLTTGKIEHEFSNYTTAKQVSELYSNSRVAAWTTATKKPVAYVVPI